ncbi:MAG: tripartite tricarboxylate transporter substrate-binding protein, partial [Gammaproteobacteria bacterium]|nr:tripartite tricarboxylate transporter substrate-binding protein [Gammaproteobacteria bacterium]
TYLKDTRLRALAIAGPNRLASLPNIPTMADAGLRGFDASAWFGISTQSGVPAETVAKLNAALNKVIQMPDVRQRMEVADMTPGGGTPQEYGSLIARERVKWGDAVRRSGARVD